MCIRWQGCSWQNLSGTVGLGGLGGRKMRPLVIVKFFCGKPLKVCAIFTYS